MKRILFLAALAAVGVANASAITFYNSTTPSGNDATINTWLGDLGLTSAEYLVDFESFSNNTDIHNVGGLFPLDLVFRDTSGEGFALVND